MSINLISSILMTAYQGCSTYIILTRYYQLDIDVSSLLFIKNNSYSLRNE